MADRIHSNGNSAVQQLSLPSTRVPSSSNGSVSEDGTNFRKGLQFDMKGLVGDAVGNMSISPGSRDVVLAARRGLFIIDLESPFEVPRFLPQGGTWDVADVQWNPHLSRAEYIVSTSSEKLLIWNLYLSGKTSIEHILHRHYRAITDINWNPAEPDILSSIGIDSWVWTWDMRETRKPILGLCAFSSPGTQVRWNRRDPNILASSHVDKVHLWDVRKGSLPLKTIEAHTSRIYGIDWSQTDPTELITCSLDKSIKVWDSETKSLKRTIKTGYPVWRARSLPFGHGVLSLAQRGETSLEMFSLESLSLGPGLTEVAVDSFQGHSDVVKEFVWRKNANNTAFQLITWSKDRTLRFWPVDLDMMQKVGYSRDDGLQAQSDPPPTDSLTTSFRDPLNFHVKPKLELDPDPNDYTPISAPIGHRSILAEVRAGGPLANQAQTQNWSRPRNNSNLYPHVQPYPIVNISALDDQQVSGSVGSAVTTTGSIRTGVNINVTGPRGVGTMSRGAAGGLRSRARVDALSWLSSVRDATGPPNSSIAASGNSTSLTPAIPDTRVIDNESDDKPRSSSRDKSGSKDSGRVEDKENTVQNVGPSLQDEITSVLSKLPASKVRLEKHDLSLTSSKKQHRTVTLGLQVPWARSESGLRHGGAGLSSGATYSYSTQSVFLRVSFTFPREYPQTCDPQIHNDENGSELPSSHLPTVNMEYTPLITMKDRAFMLRRLRRIIASLRERQRPCLEACLRFLVFKDEGLVGRDGDVGGLRGLGLKTDGGVPVHDNDSQDDLDSSEEENMGNESRDKDMTTMLLRNNKNLAEPRTCQGSFGPNGWFGYCLSPYAWILIKSYPLLGELVCFFRAPPRIVRNAIGNVLSQSRSSAQSSVERPLPDRDVVINGNDDPHSESRPAAGTTHTPPPPQTFHQSPALISDAVRRLGLAATDRDVSGAPLSTSALVADTRTKLPGDYYGTYATTATAPIESYSYASPIHSTHNMSPQNQTQITRIMTNLLTNPKLRGRRHSNSLKHSAGLDSIWEGVSGRAGGDEGRGPGRTASRGYMAMALVGSSPRRSEVVIANTTGLVGGDKSVAADYVFFVAPVQNARKGLANQAGEGNDAKKYGSSDLVEVCSLNASAAKAHGRYDHERIFLTLGAVLGSAMTAVAAGALNNGGDTVNTLGPASRWLRLIKQLLDRLVADFRAQKDVQMLAMIASIALQLFYTPDSMSAASEQSFGTRPSSALDYFSALHGFSSKMPTYSPARSTRSPLSPGSGRLPSTPLPTASGLSITPSRASWASLFSTGRNFVSGALPASNDNVDSTTVMPISPPILSPSWIAIPFNKSANSQSRVISGKVSRARFPPDSPNRSSWSRGSASPNVTTPSVVSKSWNETLPPSKEFGVSFSSTGHSRRPTFSQVASAGSVNGNRRKMVYEAAVEVRTNEELEQFNFSEEELSCLLQHVHFYSEVLARWELYHKRAELLKSISATGGGISMYEHDIGLVRLCINCSASLTAEKPGAMCESCSYRRTTPKCTICRLSVKGAHFFSSFTVSRSDPDTPSRPVRQLLALLSRYACFLLEELERAYLRFRMWL
ncbi:hypothetical protein D9757_005834 [Collybiopsis confluens]|uniref:Uncharacterized protein n=1 Tax=Collybiopsis confluens TaxID=2823264 RepID=A0A8H5HNR7_9AGAR|nr:hypothetical protein D9757_005834 [Collybiopsis confluens]